MIRRYLLHDLTIDLVSGNEALANRADHLIRYLRATPADSSGDAPVLRVSVGDGQESIPGDAERIDMHERGTALFARHGTLFLKNGSSGARVDPVDGLVHLWIRDENPGLLFDLLALGLLAVLGPRGFFLIHAAGLVYNDAGLIISARTHSGKSSLAMGLVLEGWGYLSDDMLLVSRAGKGLEARGLGSDFRLDDNALARFPSLTSGDQQPAADKHHFKVDTLFPHRYVAVCRPRVLIIPEIVDAAESSLEPITPGTVLTHLLSQTSILSRDTSHAAAHIDVLRTLALSLKAYRLFSGRDVYRNPRLAHTLLSPLTEG